MTFCDHDMHMSAELKNQITDLERAEERLSRQLEEVRISLRHAREMANRQAPISRFPVEIMEAIFHAGQELVDTENAETILPIQSFGTLVSHVIRHWRNIALSLPSLWTSIRIYERNQCEVAAFLERSKTRLLDVRIYSAEADGSHLLPGDILSHARRWRMLHVNPVHTGDYHRVVNSLAKLSTPYLQTAIFYCNKPTSCSHDNFPIFRLGTPRLTSVSLEVANLHCCWPALAPVTSLSLRKSDMPTLYDRVYSFLAGLPSLIKLRLDDISLYSPHQTRACLLPSLRILQLDNSTCSRDIFKFFLAPLLETLVYTNAHVSFEGVSSYSHHPHLQSIEFWSCSFSHKSNYSPILSVQSIMQLSFHDCDPVPFLDIVYVSIKCYVRTPWPGLCSITLSKVPLHAQSSVVSVIVDIVSSRAGLKTPLRNLHLDSQLMSALTVEQLTYVRHHLRVDRLGLASSKGEYFEHGTAVEDLRQSPMLVG